MGVKHNKLVRDKIPEIITKRGDKPVTHTLGTDSYRQELRRKLQEEVDEFCESGKVEELADILEVVYALAAAEQVSQFQLEEIRKRKRKEIGGFDQRILLNKDMLSRHRLAEVNHGQKDVERRMKVLVTGGAGYVGSNLVNTLRQAGHAVRVLDLQPANSDFIQGSVADRSLVAQAMRDVEVVCHLAWGFYPGDERREVQENLFGTLNLLEAALAAKVRHFLFASSAVVYGPTGPSRVDEKYPCHPERSAIGGPVYGITKLACEQLCLVYQRLGLPATIFRMHGVFSQGRLGQFGQMIGQALAGEPVRAIQEAGGEYAHLGDVVRAFLLAMDDPRACGEIFNLAGSHTYRDPDLARHIVETAGSESQIELVEDPTQGMISVSVDKLCRVLGCGPESGEFLTGLIRRAVNGE
jgi:UDP-glucose 4-epimerase